MRPLITVLLFALSSTTLHADSRRPSTVNNVHASSISANAIRISWNEPWDDTGVDGYNIYRNGGYYSTVFGATNFIDTGLAAATRHDYAVVAFDKARNYSTMSSSSSATTAEARDPNSDNANTAPPSASGIPRIPDGLQAEALGADQLRLQWRAPSSNITGYNVYRDGSYIATVKGRTDYTATSLVQGQVYRWQVTAFIDQRFSPMSAAISAAAGSTDSPANDGAPGTVRTIEPKVASSSVPPGYQLVFNEEFNSGRLESSRWNSRYRWGPWWTINNEEQFYVDILNDPGFEASPFELDDQSLSINAIRTPAELLGKANGKNYISGTLTTYGKFKMRYGYVEMRAQLPRGKGLWPAFWLLHNQENGSRPEIDVMEMIGGSETVIYQTYHYFDQWTLRSSPSYRAAGPDYSTGYHTFGMKWEPGRITWYVDGRQTNTHVSGNVASEDMYLLVNLAVGGSWPGSPGSSTYFPARYRIDYVRAYSPG